MKALASGCCGEATFRVKADVEGLEESGLTAREEMSTIPEEPGLRFKCEDWENKCMWEEPLERK